MRDLPTYGVQSGAPGFEQLNIALRRPVGDTESRWVPQPKAYSDFLF